MGDDEQGKLFDHNASSDGVDLSRLRKKKGHTTCLLNVTKIRIKFKRNFLTVFGVAKC